MDKFIHKEAFPDDWECANCGTMNDQMFSRCYKCEHTAVADSKQTER